MSSRFGNCIRIQLFGESHGTAVGVVLEGLPAGFSPDMVRLQAFLNRRAAKESDYSTQRKEADVPQILSGLQDGALTGTPLCAVFSQTQADSDAYTALRHIPRPAHADYPAYVQSGGFADTRGGGHNSGRLTLPLCFAGALCIQLLEKMGVVVGAKIASIGDLSDMPFDPVRCSAKQITRLRESDFPVLDKAAGEQMLAQIRTCRNEGDSIGGSIACAVVGLPAGVGQPLFAGIKNSIASAVFGIPAVCGIEFGEGFAATQKRGSVYNDAFYIDAETVRTKTNRHGGVLGGRTSGMPLILRVAVKPTPSIALAQQTVDLQNKKPVTLALDGRFDSCIVPRAVPCVEAAVALALCDQLAMAGFLKTAAEGNYDD